MSSLLNVSNDVSCKPEEFSLNDIEVIDNKEQDWFKRVHMGKFLGIVNIHRSTTKLEDEARKTRVFLHAERGIHIMNPLEKMLRTTGHFADQCPLCHCKLSKKQGHGT